jgi:hypothetical protein
MEVMVNEETMKSLLNSNTNQPINNNENIGVNCLRKKFKCVILWMLSIISITQLLIIIFDKLDEKYMNKLIEKVSGLVKSTPNKTSAITHNNP